MYTAKSLLFLYAVTPVHMGAGQALGVIDNPIQRERHTSHPSFAGSGIKGAFRHAATALWKEEGKVSRTFGPEREASEHAGAVSFADAQLVAFPVRSLKEGFVYVTSPIALQRLLRLAAIAEVTGVPEGAAKVPDDTQAVILDPKLLAPGVGGERLVLESYAFVPVEDDGSLARVADWIAEHALPDDAAYAFFREKLRKDLLLLSDTQLSFFARHATSVEPHVRLDDASGTADDGGLFFTENLPPESLMASLVMASQERRRRGDNGEKLERAEGLLRSITESFGGRAVQIGGDATTGRGQVLARFVEGGA